MTEMFISIGGVSARIQRGDSIAERHARIVAGLAQIDPPFGLKGKPLPPPPPEDCGGKGDWHCGFTIHDKMPVITYVSYLAREGWRPDYDIYQDNGDFDDNYNILIYPGFSKQDYQNFIFTTYPRVIKAFEGYEATLGFAENVDFIDELKSKTPSGARGIYTYVFDRRREIGCLKQVHFWDGLLCRRLFDISPEEVIRRLEGKVPLVRPLRDGVYVVFSEKMELTFEEFYEMNEYFQDLLGYTRKKASS